MCVESRIRALRRYTLAVPVWECEGECEEECAAVARRYIDPLRDVVFFDPGLGPSPETKTTTTTTTVAAPDPD